ncbi:hypothetical protein SAY87_028184 [Trapa incisa]|uniref:Uncharacterized protein n=1 Tax=Trapa incisa TaxID=236973 RepID=A0AAN7QRT6_9MYRT|nr:hypothetical protein SAY87_028184 [Trapa incisa]
MLSETLRFKNSETLGKWPIGMPRVSSRVKVQSSPANEPTTSHYSINFRIFVVVHGIRNLSLITHSRPSRENSLFPQLIIFRQKPDSDFGASTLGLSQSPSPESGPIAMDVLLMTDALTSAAAHDLAVANLLLRPAIPSVCISDPSPDQPPAAFRAVMLNSCKTLPRRIRQKRRRTKRISLSGDDSDGIGDGAFYGDESAGGDGPYDGGSGFYGGGGGGGRGLELRRLRFR